MRNLMINNSLEFFWLVLFIVEKLEEEEEITKEEKNSHLKN